MKVILTTSEILAKFGLSSDFELNIENGRLNKCIWTSNVGRNRNGHPENLSPYTSIEVMYHNGLFNKGCADDWNLSWNEVKTNSDCVIVAYRILKD